jgi:hypothetical protein
MGNNIKRNEADYSIFRQAESFAKILPKAVRYTSDVIPAQAGIQLRF